MICLAVATQIAFGPNCCNTELLAANAASPGPEKSWDALGLSVSGEQVELIANVAK